MVVGTPTVRIGQDKGPAPMVVGTPTPTNNPNNPTTPNGNNPTTPNGNNAGNPTGSNPIAALTENSNTGPFGISGGLLIGLLAIIALLIVVIAVVVLRQRGRRD